MLKYGEINPLNVHGLRRTEHCPPHFTPVYFDLRTSEKSISDWVWANLAGRFYFADHVSDVDGKKSMCKVVAFETASEATYFGLFLDQINVNTVW